MGRKNIEAAIQREHVKWLRAQGLEVVAYKSEGQKSGMTAALDKMSGVKAGFPDLMIFKKVRSIYHILHQELKTQKGTLNPKQILWHSEFIPTKNRQAVVSYGLHQAQEHVTKWLEDIHKK